MEKVVFTVITGKATVSAGRRDDDWADRLNSRYTPLILIVFTIITTIGQIVRNPITCWAPVHFTDSHIKYANNYCWIRNTYYLPFEEVNLPHEGEWRQLLRYYQYIQFLLLGQAAFFYLPTLVWRAFNSKAGVDADHILSTALGIQDVSKAEKKDSILRFVSSQMDRFLESRKPEENGCHCDMKHVLSGLLCRCCGRRIGNYLVMLYMFQKLLFLANIVTQFVLLGLIFGEQFWVYGAKIVSEQIPDDQWTARGFVAFPRVTLCDFKVRRLGNLHGYTLQCVLPLNLFIEKMYIFLWFWMMFVLAVSVFYFIIWSIRFIWRGDRFNFIVNHLKRQKRLESEEARQDANVFVDDYLRQDGAFLLRLIATNTNHVSTGDIIGAVWDFWCEQTNRVYDDPPSDDEIKPTLENAMKPKNHRHNVLKRRKNKKKPVEEPSERQPKKADLSRVPTLYVRGSDTIGRPRSRGSETPNGNSGNDWDDPKLEAPAKGDIPLNEIPTTAPEVPHARPPPGYGKSTLYPTIDSPDYQAAKPSAPALHEDAPLADVEDTEV